MRPTKNRYYCISCHRTKMLFGTREKAINFIRFNREDYEENGIVKPIRVYYCKTCLGWHITSKSHVKPVWFVDLEIAVERCENNLRNWYNMAELNNECKRLLKKIEMFMQGRILIKRLEDFKCRLEHIVSFIDYMKDKFKKINRQLVDLESYLRNNMFASAIAMLEQVQVDCEELLCNCRFELPIIKSFLDGVIESYARKIEDRVPAL